MNVVFMTLTRHNVLMTTTTKQTCECGITYGTWTDNNTGLTYETREYVATPSCEEHWARHLRLKEGNER